MSEPSNAEGIEERGADRALSVALREIGRLARVVEEQSGRIESLEGANVKRDSDPEPDAEPPYRMAEPENVGAAVIDAGLFVWRLSDGLRWHSTAYPNAVEWTKIVRPRPFQNCVLTTADPEPPIGSVVRADPNGPSMERLSTGWYSPAWVSPGRSWAQAALPTVTLLYRGEA